MRGAVAAVAVVLPRAAVRHRGDRITELNHHLDAIAWTEACIAEDEQARQSIAASCNTVEVVTVLTAMYVAVLRQVAE